MQLVKAFIKDATFGIALLLIATAIGLAYISLPLFGHKTLIVRSGSMAPALKVGDLIVVTTQNPKYGKLALSKPLYETGEVVAFKDLKNQNTLVTHRITGYENQNGKIFYKTKGDANNTVDTSLLPQSNIVGKADVSIAQVGQIFAFAKSKTGFATLVLFPAIVVVALEGVNIIKELRKKKSYPIIYTKAATTLKIFIPVVFSAFLFRYTYAYFSDSATSIANTFAAATSFPSPSPSSTPQPSPSPSPSSTPQPSPSPNPGVAVINEVYYRIALNHRINNSEAGSEWVEIYNSGGSSINLNGWSFSDNTSCDNIPGSPIIPAGGFAILSTHTESDFRTIWTTIPAGVIFIVSPTAVGNGLANSDEAILRDGTCPSSGTVRDHVSWGSNKNAFDPSIPTNSSGESSERNPDGQDANTAADFIDSNPPTPGS